MFSLSNLNYNDTGRVFKEMERIWLNKIKLRRNKDFVSFSNLEIYISARKIAVLTLILISWSIHILFNVLRNWKIKEGRACSYNCFIPVFYTMLYYFFKWIKKKKKGNSGWNTWIFFNFQYQLVSSLGDNQNPQSN